MQAKFTTKFVESAKPKKGQRTDYWDTDLRRLGLRVSTSGRKVWLIMYRRASDGKKRRYALGTFPLLSLGEARQAALSILARVEKGDDPAAEKEAFKADGCFSELADDFIERYAKPNRRSWQEDERRFRQSINPEIGSIKAMMVSAPDVIRLHEKITARDAPIEANRQVALVRRVYSWANSKRLLEGNPAERLELNPERSRKRVLNVDEIHILWHSLDEMKLASGTRLAIRLLLLTGQRAGEITGAEVKELDLDRSTWTIPGNRTKNGLTHTVPLSRWTVELFSEALDGVEQRFVLPSVKAGQPMTRRALSRAFLRNLDTLGLDPFTPHDLRRTVASQMAALGIDRLVVGKVLNHASINRDSITGLVYDQYGYEPEKRNALDRWASRLADIVGLTDDGAEVIRLRR